LPSFFAARKLLNPGIRKPQELPVLDGTKNRRLLCEPGEVFPAREFKIVFFG
jgi:hypothetical protein